jgi:hypothetical protein
MHLVTVNRVEPSLRGKDCAVVTNGKNIEYGTCSSSQEHDNSRRKSNALTNPAPLCVRLGGKHADTAKAKQRNKKRKDDNKTRSDGRVEIHRPPLLRIGALNASIAPVYVTRRLHSLGIVSVSTVRGLREFGVQFCLKPATFSSASSGQALRRESLVLRATPLPQDDEPKARSKSRSKSKSKAAGRSARSTRARSTHARSGGAWSTRARLLQGVA